MSEQPQGTVENTTSATNTSPINMWLVIIPYLFQAFCLILLTIILIVGNASATAETVISALLVIGTGSALAGGGVAAAHIITNKSN
jgi:hypothetical protein